MSLYEVVQVCLTLVELFLDVVLVRLVPADSVQTFCRQTCEHKPPSGQLSYTKTVLNVHSWADQRRVIRSRSCDQDLYIMEFTCLMTLRCLDESADLERE